MRTHQTCHVHSHRKTARRASRTLLIPILAIFAALSLSGCTGLTAAGTASTASAGSGSGTLAASATSLAYGNIVDGASSSQTLTLTNTGSAAVTISAGTITGAGFSVTGGIASTSMGAGQSQSYQVQFAPASTGSATGNISIVSNATNSPLAISLSGAGIAPIMIATQPASESVVAGQSASFAVAASGTGTLTYQWKKNGTAISGATVASYTTPVTTSADNGALFTVVVTDSNGNLTSHAATLTVTAAAVAPSITTQPASATVIAGQKATFSVAATGTATLAYQWNKNGAAIGGATLASYTTPATVATDGGSQFTVTVTNSAGSVTSNAATLTVNVPPTISAQPANQTVTVGQTATFSITASGTGTLTYQWKKNGTAVSGATAASYTTPATVASDNAAQFTVVVTGNAGSVTSNAVTLTVNTPPSITTQPASATVIAGQTATFSVAATGTATLKYQWNQNGTAINGATSSSYTTPATTTANSGAQFTVTVSNIAGNITSNAATLTVNAATYILNASQTSLNFSSVNIGSSSTLSVIFTNAGNSDVTVSNVTVSGAGFTASGVPSGQIVAPGQTATLNVMFTPSASGASSGSITVSSNAGSSPATITLSGTGMQPVSHSVALAWSASTSTVSGYNAYRSTVSGGPYTKLNSTLIAATSDTDTAVVSGTTYYYVATAVDSGGVESAYSTEATATIP